MIRGNIFLVSFSSVIGESRFVNAYCMNGSPHNIRKRRNSRRSSRLIPIPFSLLPLLPSFLSWLFLILSMNLQGCRWWAEIRGLLKLNPCTRARAPRAGRPEATHQERLIAEKITLLNTLPGQCFFSPVATCLPVCLSERATTRHR